MEEEAQIKQSFPGQNLSPGVLNTHSFHGIRAFQVQFHCSLGVESRPGEQEAAI